MKISRKSSYFIVIDMILGMLALIALFIFGKSYNVVFYIATFIYVFMFLSWFAISKQIFNYFSVFLGLTYIYYYGQLLLFAIGKSISFQYTINNTFDSLQIVSTAYFILECVIVLHASVICFYRKGKEKTNYRTISGTDLKAFRLTTLLLLSVSFICEVLVLGYKYTLNVTMGYATAIGTTYNQLGVLSKVVNFGSTIYLPALFSALVATKGRRFSNIYVWLTYVIYLILYFLSGSRFDAVISLAGVVLLYHCYYNRIKIKQAVLIIMIGVGVLFLCSLMSKIRIVQNYEKTSDITVVMRQALEFVKEGDITRDILSETGLQLLSVATVMKYCPAFVNYTYGKYYLYGLLRVIPNIFLGENMLITNDIDTIFHIYLTKTYGMGSSFIAEAYYNFGYLGIIMMFVYGYLIAYVCRKTDDVKGEMNQNIFLVGFLFYIAAKSFFWVRSDARMLIREIVFYYIGFKIITWIVKNLFYREGKNNDAEKGI
ncbi:MAG: O-antigen polysaccharide polymerase Wzy [Lachnospiraceae bacterium]|nr:O-antigen polysaccharide polymerase Wzy [Lachnospiraceae bacterium]